MSTATVFAIKRYALHDGPSIRTTIFFKGCPLECQWCHNPEGIASRPELVVSEEKCIGCGECVDTCREKLLADTMIPPLPRGDDCCRCFTCVSACPALAREATGWEMSLADLIAEVEKDLPFYDHGGGGVTISGGEPLCQAGILLDFLRECGRREIHRVVDTSGLATKELILEVARDTELMLVDLKLMEDQKHRYYTGVSNLQILNNLQVLSEAKRPVRVRIPLVAGVNDDADNIEATGRFLGQLKNIEGVDLLPYHGTARAKYRKLNISEKSFAAPDHELTHDIQKRLQAFIADISIGG